MNRRKLCIDSADFIARNSSTAKVLGLDKTGSAVANFCGRYFPAADSGNLTAGGYYVEHLDYDRSPNTR